MSQEGVLKFSSSGAPVVETLTGNSGGPVGPDASHNINITANTTMGITTIGNAGTNTINILGIQATTSQIGVTALASNAQAIAGTDAVNAVTSASLAAKLGTQTAHSLAVFEGTSSALTALGVATSGQIPIGSTGADPVLSTLTAGTGISIANGAGTITISGTGFSQTVIQVFSSTGTYTPTANMKYCIVELVGGGGGGGGAVNGSAGNCTAGGGGGGGGYARSTFSAATIGISQAVTIGTAGTAGTNAGGTGGTGGTTSLGALISATGGLGGVGVAVAAPVGAVLGGVGGTGTGTFAKTGMPGGPSHWVVVAGVGAPTVSGFGGNSFLGTGGIAKSDVATGAAGSAGSQGGGGSGGSAIGASGAQTGGAGGAGFVLITEFI